MNKKKIAVHTIFGLLLTATIYANTPKNGHDQLDINGIIYIEEESEIDLGFNTADYLPENFDPYKYYVDLNAIRWVETEIVYYEKHLPRKFDAFAIPTDFRNISYIDATDEIELDFESGKYLPENFDPYSPAVIDKNLSSI